MAPAQTSELPPYLQCVPYAREVSGIAIFGDAYTWWDQAEGKYLRGNEPKVGAVMAFVPTERMQLGHVATVVKVIDKRTVLLDHANWSPINGRRGQIERGVKAVDVSAKGDWSEVRVWYAPLQDLGTTRWPVAGFIYADGKPKKAKPDTRLAIAPAPKPQVSLTAPATTKPSSDFSKAFAALTEPASPPAARREVTAQAAPARAAPPPIARKPVALPPVKPKPAPQSDPYAAVLAQYD
ncbi:CHAP domain-containing protein [Erythrobacter sp. SDW2]|nr:CHAP domain-containing protein [Erythrobacter sp. SDW2]UIP08240.1 CHAP domain-containing protein [Erythrobacter sp. SDW2]